MQHKQLPTNPNFEYLNCWISVLTYTEKLAAMFPDKYFGRVIAVLRAANTT